MIRLFIHYLIAFFVLTLYGGQVCPFVESLTLMEWASSTVILFAIAFLVNAGLRKRLCRITPIPSSYVMFNTTFITFMGGSGGVAIGIYNALVRGFPVMSGLKLIMGWFLIGFFYVPRHHTCK